MRKKFFATGDTVILDRAREIFKHGRNTRFDRRLYRAWAIVREVQSDGRMVLEWFDIPDGQSRGTHGAGIGRDYLIHLHEVVSGERGAEDPESVAQRLADMRRGEAPQETSEPVRSALRDSHDPFPVGCRVQIVSSQWDHDEDGPLGTVIECPSHSSPSSVVRSVMLDGIQGDSDPEPGEPGEPTSGWAYGVRDLLRVGDGLRRENDMTDGLMSADNAGRGAALAHGDRQKAYGHPKVSFDRIASFWSAYLAAPEIDPENLSAEDVGHMMNLLKISRSITDKGEDTIDDIEGYVTCIRMIRQYEAETE
jgi:hypothetical protein